MTQLPNIITLLRIADSLGLLLCDVTSVAYWIIYALCGISDIADGWLARKLRCVTMKGALLDSLADICFRHLLRSMLCLEAPADTRIAAMVMAVGRGNCCD